MSYESVVSPKLNLSIDEDFGGIQLLSLRFLCAVVNGEVDAHELLEYELAARGYDSEGIWIGFSTLTNTVLARHSRKHKAAQGSPA